MTTCACRFSVIVFVLAAALLASVSAGAQDAKVWRHGVIEPKSDAGIFLMVTNGFAEKQGIKLEIVPFKSDQVGLRAMIAGEIDSYEGALIGTLVAASKGVDVKLLGCHWQSLPHGIFARDAIKSPQDLRGKTIAISTPFSHPDYLARALLAKNNIPVSEVKLANMGGDADRFKALVAGVVDATVVSSEYVPIAAKNGVHLMVSARDVMPEYIRLCIFSTDRSLAKRDTAINFLAAEMKGLRYALSHRDEAMALTRKITGAKVDDPRPEYIYDDAIKTSAVDPNVGIPMEKIKWMQNRLVADGQLAAGFDINKMIEPSVRAKALELAGSGH
jgi:NitT/TauT family transport system substrate-binding protein